MGKYSVNLIGDTYGRLRVIDECPDRYEYFVKKGPSKGQLRSQSIWLCKCECGTLSKVRTCNLVSGNTTSCGCRKAEVNSHKLKDVWKSFRTQERELKVS